VRTEVDAEAVTVIGGGMTFFVVTDGGMVVSPGMEVLVGLVVPTVPAVPAVPAVPGVIVVPPGVCAVGD